MVGPVSVRVGAYVAAEEPYLAVFDDGIRIGQVCLAGAARLHLGSHKYEPRLVGLLDEVVVARFAVLSYQFGRGTVRLSTHQTGCLAALRAAGRQDDPLEDLNCARLLGRASGVDFDVRLDSLPVDVAAARCQVGRSRELQCRCIRERDDLLNGTLPVRGRPHDDSTVLILERTRDDLRRACRALVDENHNGNVFKGITLGLVDDVVRLLFAIDDDLTLLDEDARHIDRFGEQSPAVVSQIENERLRPTIDELVDLLAELTSRSARKAKELQVADVPVVELRPQVGKVDGAPGDRKAQLGAISLDTDLRSGTLASLDASNCL